MTERTAYKRDVMAERAEAVANERGRCLRAIRECVGLTDDEKRIAMKAILARVRPMTEREVKPRDLTVARVDEHGVAYNTAGESIGMTGKTGHKCSGAVGVRVKP